MSLDIYLTAVRPTTVFEGNLTHNLNAMAHAACIYRELWRPDELGVTKAGELITALENGLNWLKAEPAYFKRFNPPNGWGDYGGFIKVVEQYLQACKDNPDAEIRVSR